jgi:hypothetical protein
MIKATGAQPSYDRRARGYHICVPQDSKLYVDVPTGDHLVNLLLNSQFRGAAHFRTESGRTPYSGGGIAFEFRPLALHGVQPIWYPKDLDLSRSQTIRDAVVAQLVEDGVYADETEASRHYAQKSYASECEWLGEPGMRFDPSWIIFAWFNPRKPPSPAGLAAVREALPSLELRNHP